MVPTVPTQGLVCTNIFPSTHLHLHLDVHLGAHRDVDRGPGGVGIVDVPHQVGLRVPNVKNKPGNRHKGVRDGCETDHTRPMPVRLGGQPLSLVHCLLRIFPKMMTLASFCETEIFKKVVLQQTYNKQ